MIRLSKVRLVRWHIFSDITVNIGEMTLFAGDNGSGKSTVIDAVQYAMVADLTHVKFNSAASDRKTGRSLDSYCRGKIGAEDLAYIRGDCVSHVMLEFTSGKKTFCAGIAIDAYMDGSRPDETPWIIDECGLSSLGASGSRICDSVKNFKEHVKASGGSCFTSKRQYVQELTQKLGVFRRNADFNPYLEALVRAVSFTPLSSVDQFICSYILEDKPLDVTEMKQNLENYRIAEKEAHAVAERIQKLEQLEKIIGDIRSEERKISLQKYLKYRLESELALEAIHSNAKAADAAKAAIDRNLESEKSAEEEFVRMSYTHEDCIAALSRNDAYILYNSLTQKIESCSAEILHFAEQKKRKDLLSGQVEALVGRKLGSDYGLELESLEKERADSFEKKNELQSQKAAAEKEVAGYSEELGKLKQGIVRYPEPTEMLKRVLEEENIPCQVFSDMLEVRDEDWQNAVEGWLNTQRFNLLVAPDNYQRAIEIYRAQPRTVAGVGLPDIEKMRSSKPKTGSLFDIVTAQNSPAQVYASYLLGDVMMATVETLKDHSKSVTKDCMRYASFTASRIRADVYDRWYIGKKARERRIALCEKELSRLRAELAGLTNQIEKLMHGIELLNRAAESLFEIRSLSGAETLLAQKESEKISLETQRSGIDVSSCDSLKKQIEAVKGQLREIEERKKQIAQEKGRLHSRLEYLSSQTGILRESYNERNAVFTGFAADIDDIESYRTYFSERTREADPALILKNYEPALKSAETRREKIFREYAGLLVRYNRDYNESLGEYPEHPDDASHLLKKYRDTELPQYEERISNARKNAEYQFMGDFVSRLSENIKNARENIKELNMTLKSISFGRDRYRFTIEEKAEKRGEISVIQKAADISRNKDTLFESLTTPEDKKTVEQLFKTILEKDLSSPEVLAVCDYRKYFQYDIKMIDTSLSDENGGKEIELSLSRVIRDKSGGEAQTPYYVAIAASFLRFFSRGETTIRLALFDEAFNKMDDSRIENTIEFFKKIGLQVITAVPTEKIETIAPYMDTTNIVIRHGTSADVRQYRITGKTGD